MRLCLLWSVMMVSSLGLLVSIWVGLGMLMLLLWGIIWFWLTAGLLCLIGFLLVMFGVDYPSLGGFPRI
ncbi:hypothetical protein B6U84_05425 [Candidatus Bathyarchaeota archaeon ex4484_40]|nr:MAG: hypothetical protein B6U84_05425 [Candidatus Bathyarchaeota archaeon ex4484_40]